MIKGRSNEKTHLHLICGANTYILPYIVLQKKYFIVMKLVLADVLRSLKI